MSNYISISELLVDLSTKEQQLMTGGNTGSMKSNIPIGNNDMMGDGFPNVTGKTPFANGALGDGFPNPPHQNPFVSYGASDDEEEINAHQNNMGTVLY